MKINKYKKNGKIICKNNIEMKLKLIKIEKTKVNLKLFTKLMKYSVNV
jgi:hypothetical protein